MRFTAGRNEPVFGSDAQPRVIAGVDAATDGHRRFVSDSASVWDEVMMLDRDNVKGHRRFAPGNGA